MPVIADMPPQAPIAVSAEQVLEQTPAEREAATALKALQARLPRTQVDAAHVTPIPGLYALETRDGPTLYVTPDARYMVIGVMFDLATGKTLHGLAAPQSTALPPPQSQENRP